MTMCGKKVITFGPLGARCNKKGVCKVLHQVLRDTLEEQLADASIAQCIAQIVQDHLLTWLAPFDEVTQGVGVIALAFGYQQVAGGTILPGPVNVQLANRTVEIYERLRCPIYAQWEIAAAVESRIPPQDITAIHPRVDPTTGLEKYLSTYGVIAQIRDIVGDRACQGRFFLVCHRDHSVRSYRIAKKLGFASCCTPPPSFLPVDYDPDSAQPWTRSREAYLVHDILSRLESFRAEQFGTESPSRQLD